MRVFSYNADGQIGYLINPEIRELSGGVSLVDEGCLSVPGLWHKTPRHKFARVVGFNLAGEQVEISGEGLLGQALQHECDHLWGTLYPMRVRDFSRFGFTEVLFPGLDAADD